MGERDTGGVRGRRRTSTETVGSATHPSLLPSAELGSGRGKGRRRKEERRLGWVVEFQGRWRP